MASLGQPLVRAPQTGALLARMGDGAFAASSSGMERSRFVLSERGIADVPVALVHRFTELAQRPLAGGIL